MIDFEKEFDDFVIKSGDNDPITSLYSLFPSMTDNQMKVYSQLSYMCQKYDSINILNLLTAYTKMKTKNKNMDFFNSASFRKLIEGYSLVEHMKGVRINANSESER